MLIQAYAKRVIIALVLTLGAAAPASAQAIFTPWARISHIQAGWVVDRMLVFHNTPAITNPGGCPLVTNGYIINETDPGRRTFYAMLLGALLNGREATFVVSGCFQSRPRIVSVAVR